MYDIQSFLNGLDSIYKSGHIKDVEPYLRSGLEGAMGAKDDGAVFTILNEMMGYYRGASRHEEGQVCIQAAFKLAAAMGITDTPNYAAFLINGATGYRAAGNYEESERLYKEAALFYSKNKPADDYVMATLHNNLSLLYGETGRFREAKEELLLAMDIIRHVEGAKIEIAITHTNLGSICFRLREFSEGTRHMLTAVEIFEESPDQKDSHYASALAGLGEAYYHAGKLDQSVASYEKALEEIKGTYGHNDYYRITEENLNKVKDLKKRQTRFLEQKKSGLELSREYFETYGRPMIHSRYPDYENRIAAGLVGEGSECLGFDDFYSTDHDYGPGFCLWLERKDYDAIGKALAEDYQALPKEFMGFPSRNSTDHGQQRVGVFEIGDFYRRLTGCSDVPSSHELWGQIPQEALRTATNGEVFQDPLGLFTAIRNGFLDIPEEVHVNKLALALGKTAQAGQYNYSRARIRGDLGAMYLSLNEFINGALETGYLLNRIYMPFYKWRMRGTEDFSCLTDLKTRLEEMMNLEIRDACMEERVEEICLIIVRELNLQGITHSMDAFLEHQKQEILSSLKETEGQSDDKGAGSRKDRMIQEITAAEWGQFQKVHNEGGRALCQDDYETFEIMRKSQFLTWDLEVLCSYRSDLRKAEHNQWNLIMEKYARMMESTAPRQYANLKDMLPKLEKRRIKVQEEIIATEVEWAKEFMKRYPKIGARGRRIHSWEDTSQDTSAETYLRGELGTYSDRTLERYRLMVNRCHAQGKNLKEMNVRNMIGFYGYESLEAAENA